MRLDLLLLSGDEGVPLPAVEGETGLIGDVVEVFLGGELVLMVVLGPAVAVVVVAVARLPLRAPCEAAEP